MRVWLYLEYAPPLFDAAIYGETSAKVTEYIIVYYLVIRMCPSSFFAAIY